MDLLLKGGRQICWMVTAVVCFMVIVSMLSISRGQSAALDASFHGANHASDITLRILPLGDSTTRGGPDDRFNSYRPALRNLLIGSGRTIEYMGTQEHGDSLDNRHEGHAGLSIKLLQQKIAENGILLQHPNVILLHAGTNDMMTPFMGAPPDDPYSEAPQRLNTLIEAILCECPDAVLLVAKIIDDMETDSHSRVQLFNSGVEMIVAHWQSKGYHTQLADHSAVTGSDLGNDGMHPTNVGYEKMAKAWFDAMQALPSVWIKPAREAGLVPSSDCQAKASR